LKNLRGLNRELGPKREYFCTGKDGGLNLEKHKGSFAKNGAIDRYPICLTRGSGGPEPLDLDPTARGGRAGSGGGRRCRRRDGDGGASPEMRDRVLPASVSRAGWTGS
jgi:hypothetical protein